MLTALLDRPKSITNTTNGTGTSTGGAPANANDNNNNNRPDARGPSRSRPPELPRRLFRHLSASGDEALPLLCYLYHSSTWPYPDADSHDGYALVRLLVEPPDVCPEKCRAGKRRKLADWFLVNLDMLKSAATRGAQDIAEYLMNEKGCVPDLEALFLLGTGSHFVHDISKLTRDTVIRNGPVTRKHHVTPGTHCVSNQW